MNDSDSPTDTELSLGRTVLEPQDATEIRKWRTSTSLGPGLQSFPLDFDPTLISPDQTDYLLARFLEFDTVPLSGVKVFVSNLASAMASSAAGAESSASPTVARPPLEFARAILAMVLHAGLVHGMSMRPLLWLGSALAVASTKRKYRIARSVELGNERHYVEALLEALRGQASQAGTISATSQSSSGNPGVAASVSREGATTTYLSRERAPLNVFKLPLEYTEFEGPTSATPYAAFKGGVQTSINFYGIDNDRDCMLFLFRHIGKGLRSEIITHLGTAQPAPSAIWEYLDSRFVETDTSESASERWEALKQHTGEKVDEFYARVKSEWLLFSRVSGVTLPLPFVSAKFVGGLLPDIKAPLEASCGHQLPKLPLEEARDAVLYHESRVSSSRSEGSSRKVNSNKRQSLPVGQAPQSNQSGTKEVREPPVGKDDATGGSDTKGNKPRCSFCATRRYRGSNKHDDAHCWKNPANAHLVPEWYRQRQAEAAAAKAPKGSGDGQETAQKPTSSTFMAHSIDSPQEGLRVVKASATGSAGRVLPVDLLVDSGSDLSLISSSSASLMGLRVTPARGLRKLESAGSLGSICVIGQARVPIVVVDKDGKDLSFNLMLNVADGLNMKLGRSTIILGMETLKRLEATLHTTDDTLYCGALDSTWPLSPYRAGSISIVVADTRLRLPTKAKIDERPKGWSFPKATVQLKPGAVRPCPKRPYVCRKREMQAMELMVNNLERVGIVTRLSRAAVDYRQVWISPAFAVPKASVDEVTEPLTAENVDRAYRLVVDERCINESVKDLLPSRGTYMRSVDECLAELPASDVWYVGLDVGQAFFNLEYDESCSHLFGFAYYDSAGTVRYALFRYMTMGFKLSSFFWAYAIHSLLATAIPEAYCTDGPTHILTFVDDILAWSRFIDECVHLKSLLVYILEKVNAKAPIAKRKGPAREIDYLGLTLVQGGYRVSDATLENLRTNLKTKPLTLRGLRTKLGLLQFCRSLWRPERNRAEKTLSHLTAPFTSLVGSMVAAKSKKTARLPWTADLEAAWKAIGDNMGNAFVPFHSQMDNWDGMQLVLMSDASPEAGAACRWRLSREKFATNPERVSADWLSDNAQLIGVWTHEWSTYEKAYDIADRELYAICHALAHWRQLILSFLNFHKLHSSDSHPGTGRVTVFMDSTSALGKIEGRLNSSTYQPTTRQTKRWLSWLADLLEYDEADLTYRHAKGKDNSFSDLLSRLAQGGQRYVPEGGGETFVLVTPASSSPSDSATAGNLPSVHGSAKSILEGDLRSQLISLQKADSSTLLHGCSLQTWQLHFDGSGRLQRLATEAKTLGLVSCVDGVVMTISEASITGPISVPVIPEGAVKGLNDMIGTNVDVDWKLRDWFLFIAHEMDYHRPHRDMRDALIAFVWWPSLLRDARSWVERCEHCMEQKPVKRMKLLTAPRVPWGLIDLDARGKHVAIDHGYPSRTWVPPVDSSLKAFLVITDLATGFTILCSAEDVKGGTTAKILYSSWVSVFGVPLSVTGDNFIDAPSLRAPLLACGVRFNTVPAYSPFSNGSAEERVGRVKRILPSIKLPWDQALPFVQLSINTQKRVSGHSAAELMFGTQIRTPSASLLSSVTNNVPVAFIADLEALATSSDVPDALREVLEASVGAARISTLQAHVRDCLRASAARPGRPLKDGELVVWRRPECRPVEGTVRLVSGVNVEDGPFCYLGSLAGFITRLHPLGSPPDHSVSVSACHLEARHAFVDRDRPALAVETTIPFIPFIAVITIFVFGISLLLPRLSVSQPLSTLTGSTARYCLLCSQP